MEGKMSNSELLEQRFSQLKSESGIDIALDPVDYIRHMSPSQLVEFSTCLYLLLDHTTSHKTELFPVKTVQHKPPSPVPGFSFGFSIEVTAPDAGEGGESPRPLSIEGSSASGDSGATSEHERDEPRSRRGSIGISDDGYDCINEWLFIDCIGQGQCGRVMLACHQERNETRAIKIVPRDALLPSSTSPVVSGSMNSKDSDADLAAFQQEVAIMKKLRHRNIVALHEVIDDPEEGNIYLVMQYVDNGPLVKFTDDRCETISPDLAKKYLKQMVAGLSYLDRHHIVHRDIKPDNILVSSDGTVYVADFGMSEMVGGGVSASPSTGDNNSLAPKKTRQRGTPAFMAPEICTGGVVSIQSDIWSLGVTFYCALVGELPFKGKNWSETVDAICNQPPHIPESLPVVWKDLLTAMLEKDESNRIDLPSLRRSPFLRDRSDSLLYTPSGKDSFKLQASSSLSFGSPLTPMESSFILSDFDVSGAISKARQKTTVVSPTRFLQSRRHKEVNDPQPVNLSSLSTSFLSPPSQQFQTPTPPALKNRSPGRKELPPLVLPQENKPSPLGECRPSPLEESSLSESNSRKNSLEEKKADGEKCTSCK